MWERNVRNIGEDQQDFSNTGKTGTLARLEQKALATPA